MKKIILALISTLAIISCDNLYLEEINAIHKEMDVLRELIDRANSNVDAMHVVVSALQANDYVTGVTPIVENGVTTGYTIAFSKSGLAHIYHGTDGKDGYTPQISIKKDTDGLYYWTLDGQWMRDNAGQKVRAVGIDGEDGKDGENGKDGEDGKDGQNGQNGKDGVTPKLKIEDGYWYVSLDNGATWLEKTLGQATGDKGDKGDAYLSGVDNTNSDYVIITLANGETIKLPTWSAFEALKEQCDKMNKNISALQTAVTALENNDYVKSVTPIYDGIKEIGYIINFTKSEKVTIYHGNDGKDGENGDDGKDGYTPQISIKKDTDGLYYWTLDGEWMYNDENQKVCAVAKNGENGTNGENGLP